MLKRNMKSTLIIFASVSWTTSERDQTETSQKGENRIFSSQTYFDVVDKPVLANGHIGYVPFSDFIYMDGLFNDYIKTSSHRARIPSFANIHFESCGSAHTVDKSRCSYKLDAQ